MNLEPLVIGEKDSCWEWTGSLAGRGYGTASHEGRNTYVHRFVYELCSGKIPEGMTIDHLCENKICANPAHLRVTTQRENILRGSSVSAQNARKQACPRCGGEYEFKSSGGRFCRPCRDEKFRQYYKEVIRPRA